MKRFLLRNKMILIALGVLILVLTGCAGAENIEACTTGKTYGFWSGIWHGFIALFTFVVSLFDKDVAMYAVNNNGGWYDFGFIIGLSIFGFGGGRGSKR